MALHDCDITTYDRYLPARLLYPVANPSFSFEFCKGYYPRIARDRLGGRVTRLFVTPLLRALKKILGAINYLEFMDSFRYPLSGEFSMRKDLMKTLRIPGDWGLEIGVLNDLAFDRNSEEQCVEVFSQSIITAGESFASNPMETPFIPNWNRILSAVPDIGVRLVDSVSTDNGF